MSRFQHFLKLCDLDGIVSARTLALAAGCTRDKASAWLYVQHRRGRIQRVATGRYARSTEPRKPTPAIELEWQRKSQKKIRDKRRALGICQCGAPSPKHWKCFDCRRVQTLHKRGERARKHALAAPMGGCAAPSAGSISAGPPAETSTREAC